MEGQELADLGRADILLNAVGDSVSGTASRLATLAILSRTADLCRDLIKEQRKRVFCIKQQSRTDRSIEHYIARNYFGYHIGLPEAERKKIFAQVTKIRKVAENGEDQDLEDTLFKVLTTTRGLLSTSAMSRQWWDKHRGDSEAAMRKLAQQLPVWPWAVDVKGLSDLGLAVIVSEAGHPLDAFANPAKLWKRLGLAVLNGRRQGSPGTGATAEDWQEHGYNPSRRAQIWAFVDDMVVRAQWRAEKDDVPAHGIGEYGVYYGEMKARYVEREWKPAHADRAARRAMTKRIVRDLWRAWRDA